jgi:hypothetical protein
MKCNNPRTGAHRALARKLIYKKVVKLSPAHGYAIHTLSDSRVCLGGWTVARKVKRSYSEQMDMPRSGRAQEWQ